MVHGADDRHQVEHVAGAPIVGQGHDDEFINGVAEQEPKLPNPLVVGTVAAAHRSQSRAQPRHIATFKCSGWLDGADDRDAECAIGVGKCCGFAVAQGLSHAAENGAPGAHDRRITHINRIQVQVLRCCCAVVLVCAGALVHRRACAKQFDKPLVLLDGSAEIWRRSEIERLPLLSDRCVINKRLARVAHQDAIPGADVRHGRESPRQKQAGPPATARSPSTPFPHQRRRLPTTHTRMRGLRRPSSWRAVGRRLVAPTDP